MHGRLLRFAFLVLTATGTLGRAWADRKIVRRGAPTPEFVKLMKDTSWGATKVLVRLTDAAHSLSIANNGSYLSIEDEGGKVHAGYVIYPKRVKLAGTNIDVDAMHGGFLATRPESQGQGLASALVSEAGRIAEKEMSGSRIEYVFVEKGNRPSVRTFNVQGHYVVRPFSVFGYSRLQVKPSHSVERLVDALGPSGKSAIIDRLETQNPDVSLTDYKHSLAEGDYLVNRKDGLIRAGAQVTSDSFIVKSVGSPVGNALMGLLPLLKMHLPGKASLADIFNPKKFDHLRFGNVYVDERYPEALTELLDHALAQKGLFSGALWLDENSSPFRALKEKGFGWADAFVRTPFFMMAKPVGLSSEDVAVLRQQPIHVSPIDP